jgi:DdrB-like nuclease
MSKKTYISEKGIKIEDAGQIAPYGRIAFHWSNIQSELIKFTKADTFNQKVQTEPKEFIEYFGFKSVEFGNWMSQEDRLEFLYAAAHGFEIIRRELNVPSKYIGLNKELSIAFGARGRTNAVAHYEPRQNAINITKTKATKGGLFHEYAHAVDHITYEKITESDTALNKEFLFSSGGHSVIQDIVLPRLKRKDLIGDMERIFEKLFWKKDQTMQKWLIDFNKHSKSEYEHRRNEIWARTSEVWCLLVAKKNMTKNSMLNEFKYDSIIYPPVTLVGSLFDDIKTYYIRSLKFLQDGNQSAAPKKVRPVSKNNINGKTTEISTQTEDLKATYALFELNKLVQSNDPHTFKPNPKYPAKCQTRDYNEVKGEQEKVIKYASNFKPSHLVNNSPDATTGTPIITPDGIVLGGNGRTMILKRLSITNWNKYQSYLKPKIESFGLTKSELDSYKKPVLVRLLENVPLSKCSYYSDTLNSNTMQSFDPVTKAISIAKSVDNSTFEYIANIFDDTEGDTFAKVLSVGRVQDKIISKLTEKKFINTSNRDVWLDGKSLSSKGKETLENILLAYILPDKKLIEKAKIYTNKIVKALPLLIKINQFKSDWNIIPDIQKVIELENSRRSTGQTKTDFLNQDDIFKKGKNPKVPEKTQIVWSMLDSGILNFKDSLSSYIRTYDNENSGSNMFGGEKATPLDVLKNLKSKNGLSDRYRATGKRVRKVRANPSKPHKKQNNVKYEGQNLSDKAKKSRKTKSSKKKIKLTFLDRFFGVTS